MSDVEWEFTVSGDPSLVIPNDELRMIIVEVRQAATSAGLTFESEKIYDVPPPPSYEDMEENENWLRSMHWDLPAQNLADLWPILGLHPTAPFADRREALLQFMKIPTWRPAPDRIKAEAAEFLDTTSGLGIQGQESPDPRSGPAEPTVT